MDEKTLKDKLRELFENIKQKQWERYQLITEKNGETILLEGYPFESYHWGGEILEEAIIEFGDCGCDNFAQHGMRYFCDINEPVLCLVADILKLAFEFTKE